MPQRKKEESKAPAPRCPRCGHRHVIKSGLVQREQRWKCKSCTYQFTRAVPRGRPLWQKSLVVFLYSYGVSLHSIARIFNIQPSTALKWVRIYSHAYATGKPEDRSAMIMEMKELAIHFNRPRGKGKSSRGATLWIAINDEIFEKNVGIKIGPQ